MLTNRILYKDEAIIVINKPANMPVHKGSGGGENLEQYLHELCFESSRPPILAHRLDRDTSGCLILGRNKASLKRIGKMFMAGRISKTYWAVLTGNLDKKEGRIDIPLRKQSPLKHRWWMESHPEGQSAITDYKVMGEADNATFLELYPRTGRTHQIRVHCKSIGHPIIGDKVYGSEETPPYQQLMHLHARKIIIPQHDKPPIEVTAPPPAHMLELLRVIPPIKGSDL